MSVFENLTRKVSDTAKAAAKKSGELVEITKLNMNISAEEDKIKKVYLDIGKSVYEAYNNGDEIPEAFKAQCDMVRSYEDNIKEMKQKILDLKELKLCADCGAQLELNVSFCSKCGARQ